MFWFVPGTKLGQCWDNNWDKESLVIVKYIKKGLFRDNDWDKTGTVPG